jgi:hypothetical protein
MGRQPVVIHRLCARMIPEGEKGKADNDPHH